MKIAAREEARDYLASIILVVLGAAVTITSTDYTIGSLVNMGPGFVPAVLGVVLIFVGVVLLATTLLQDRNGAPLQDAVQAIAPVPRLDRGSGEPKAEWRGWTCICLGVLAFGGMAEHFGLVPATFACVFVTALGDRENNLGSAALLALGMTIGAVIVFWWGLGVLLPLFKWELF